MDFVQPMIIDGMCLTDDWARYIQSLIKTPANEINEYQLLESQSTNQNQSIV
jgi:hypothetical protein